MLIYRQGRVQQEDTLACPGLQRAVLGQRDAVVRLQFCPDASQRVRQARPEIPRNGEGEPHRMASVRVRILSEDDRTDGVKRRCVKSRQDLRGSRQDEVSTTSVRDPLSDRIKSLRRSRMAESIGPVGRDHADRRPASFRVHDGRV
jgi:hypothetical protein